MERLSRGILILSVIAVTAFVWSAVSRMSETTLLLVLVLVPAVCVGPALGVVLATLIYQRLPRAIEHGFAHSNSGEIVDAIPAAIPAPVQRVNVPRFSSSHSNSIRDVELATVSRDGEIVVSRNDLLRVANVAGVEAPTRAVLAECGIVGHERAQDIVRFLVAHDLVDGGRQGRAPRWRDDVSPDSFREWVAGLAR